MAFTARGRNWWKGLPEPGEHSWTCIENISGYRIRTRNLSSRRHSRWEWQVLHADQIYWPSCQPRSAPSEAEALRDACAHIVERLGSDWG